MRFRDLILAILVLGGMGFVLFLNPVGAVEMFAVFLSGVIVCAAGILVGISTGRLARQWPFWAQVLLVVLSGAAGLMAGAFVGFGLFAGLWGAIYRMRGEMLGDTLGAVLLVYGGVFSAIAALIGAVAAVRTPRADS